MLLYFISDVGVGRYTSKMSRFSDLSRLKTSKLLSNGMFTSVIEALNSDNELVSTNQNWEGRRTGLLKICFLRKMK